MEIVNLNQESSLQKNDFVVLRQEKVPVKLKYFI